MTLLQILLGLSAAIIVLIAKEDWKSANGRKRAGIIAAIVLIALAYLKDYYNNEKEENLKNINATVFSIKSEQKVKVAFPIIDIGRSTGGFALADGVFALDSTGHLMSIFIVNGKLQVFAKIRNRKGEVIANVESNECTLFSDDYEYNNDDNGFELVTKGERDVYFHIDLKDGVAHIEGFLIGDGPIGMYISQYSKRKTAGLVEPFRIKDSVKLKLDPIKPLFKYPRSTHFRERAN